MYPPYNTKLYRVTQNNQVQTLIFKRSTGTKLLLEDETGLPVTMPTNQYQNLFMSKRMVLTELEEELRRQLDIVHKQMKAMQIEFNPIAPFDIVVSPVHNPAKPVHQYDLKTYRYLRSFNSGKEAQREIAPGSPGSNIHNVCTSKVRSNGYPALSAYGFRWSYEKFDRLPSFK